jgi:hypothetical protein
MKLIKLTKYRLRYYEEPRPCIATLRKDVKENRLKAGFIDEKGFYWVDLDLLDATNVRSATDVAIEDLLMRCPEAENQIRGI